MYVCEIVLSDINASEGYWQLAERRRKKVQQRKLHLQIDKRKLCIIKLISLVFLYNLVVCCDKYIFSLMSIDDKHQHRKSNSFPVDTIKLSHKIYTLIHN